MDGNHIVRVLIELKKEWEACKNAGEAEQKGEDLSWLKAGLKKQFEEGFEFPVFAFVGIAYDEVKHKVWCGHTPCSVLFGRSNAEAICKATFEAAGPAAEPDVVPPGLGLLRAFECHRI